MAPSAMPNGVNGANGANGVNGISHDHDYPPARVDGPYQVLNQYHSKPSKMRVACAGAGASGLCLAYKMERMLEPGSWELTLYEKNPQFGGTWYENTYPGVACDIPSHDYNFTWDPKPDWSQFFASGKEIQGYFENFAERHGSKKYMQLNSKITEAAWDNDEGQWNLTIVNPQTGATRKDWAHVFINGAGILNNWKWPDIEGLHDFKGPLLHSACWNHDINFEGITAGIIGIGSTAVQIVPQLQKICKELQVYIRSPTWISPPFGAGALTEELQADQDVNPGQRQYDFTEADIEKFQNDPEYHLEFRKKIEAEINSLFGMYQQNSDLANQFRETVTKEMLRRMGPGHEDLKNLIIPKWSVGCRRISPGDGFLEALVQDNVTPVFSSIKRVVPEGIETIDGKVHKMDALVCATGFQVAFQPAFTVRNGEGKSIKEDWTQGPNLYMGVSAPRFPNYYTIVGPGATWSNGTLIPSIETTIEYSIKCMKKMQTEGIKAMAVKQDALDALLAHFDEYHKATVWQEECRSWFKDGQIKNRIYIWPGATIHFLKSIKNPRWEDYDYTYRYKNRFAYLGNGSVKATASGDVLGLSPYIRNSDHEWDID